MFNCCLSLETIIYFASIDIALDIAFRFIALGLYRATIPYRPPEPERGASDPGYHRFHIGGLEESR
jgi:hypothetical protein